MSQDNPLRTYVREHATNRPGVYRMLGTEGEVLYVGKSIRVRGRLLSYFRADRSDKATELVREARQIAWEYVPSEFAALVREMKLIQRWQPRYNVQHRRRPRYAFVKITREAAPRVLPVTRVVEDGATYYGPFPAVGRVAQTIHELGRVLELRDCAGATRMHFADQLDFWSPDRTPRCIRADLGTCLGPCCGRIPEAAYLERVAEARSFLDGPGAEPLRRMDRAMQRAAQRLDFEYAAILRDRGDRLRRFQDDLLAFRGQVDSLSFVYTVPGFQDDDRVYLIRRGTIRAEFPAPATGAERAAAAARIREVFGSGNPGAAGLRAEEASEILLVARWFRLREDERARAVSPRRWLTGRRAADVTDRGGPEARRSRTAGGDTARPARTGSYGTRTQVASVAASTARRE